MTAALRRYIPAAIILVLELPVLWPLPLHLGDWFQFWYAGHLVTTGASPYDIANWEPLRGYGEIVDGFAVNTYLVNPPFIWLYPPWTGIALAPIGALPLQVGITVMHVLVLVAGVAAVVFTTRAVRPRTASSEALLLVIGVASLPFVLATRVGHFEAVLVLGLLLLADGLRLGSSWRLAVGAVVVALKPHLFIVLGLVVLAALVRQRRRRAIVAVIATLGIVAIVSQAISPIPLTSLPVAVPAKLTLNVATTWALAALVGAGPLAGAAIVVAAAWLGSHAVAHAGADERAFALISVATAVSLIAAPYAQTYDLFVLLPAVGLTIARVTPAGTWDRGAVAAATVIALVAGAWFFFFFDLVVGSQAPSAILPIALLGLLVVSGLRLDLVRAERQVAVTVHGRE